eukprot:6172615-Pleurochrysis_carterae.AAC.1
MLLLSPTLAVRRAHSAFSSKRATTTRGVGRLSHSTCRRVATGGARSRSHVFTTGAMRWRRRSGCASRERRRMSADLSRRSSTASSPTFAASSSRSSTLTRGLGPKRRSKTLRRRCGGAAWERARFGAPTSARRGGSSRNGKARKIWRRKEGAAYASRSGRQRAGGAARVSKGRSTEDWPAKQAESEWRGRFDGLERASERAVKRASSPLSEEGRHEAGRVGCWR